MYIHELACKDLTKSNVVGTSEQRKNVLKVILRAYDAYLKNNFIVDENDPLSK